MNVELSYPTLGFMKDGAKNGCQVNFRVIQSSNQKMVGQALSSQCVDLPCLRDLIYQKMALEPMVCVNNTLIVFTDLQIHEKMKCVI